MKLWYSTTSPYVRKVLVTIKHHKLEDKVELLKIASSFDPNSPHNRDNPLGRVPALQTDNGEWLFNSLLISEFLDHQGTASALIPKDESRWAALNLHALADGIMENTTPMMAERLLRPEQEWWTSRHQQLMERNLRSFTQLKEKLQPFGDNLNIGTITAVAVIDWWLFRRDKLGYDITADHPDLVKWAERMNERYDFLTDTKPR